jgi:hypothetical protein
VIHRYHQILNMQNATVSPSPSSAPLPLKPRMPSAYLTDDKAIDELIIDLRTRHIMPMEIAVMLTRKTKYPWSTDNVIHRLEMIDTTTDQAAELDASEDESDEQATAAHP